MVPFTEWAVASKVITKTKRIERLKCQNLLVFQLEMSKGFISESSPDSFGATMADSSRMDSTSGTCGGQATVEMMNVKDFMSRMQHGSVMERTKLLTGYQESTTILS